METNLTCPACGAAVAAHHRFCKACDADLPLPPDTSREAPRAERKAGHEKSCAVCGGSIRATATCCPWCGEDQPGDELTPPASSVPASSGAADVTAGTALRAPEVGLGAASPPKGTAGTTALPADRAEGIERGAAAVARSDDRVARSQGAPVEVNRSRLEEIPTDRIVRVVESTAVDRRRWTPSDAVPITAMFNAGPALRAGHAHVLELQLFSRHPAPLRDVEIEIESRVITDRLDPEKLAAIRPGSWALVALAGFVPQHPGADVLRFRIRGSCATQGDFHLQGQLRVSIQEPPPPQQGPLIHFDFSNAPVSSPVTVFTNDLERLADRQANGRDGDATRWIEIELDWDERAMDRGHRTFPEPCVTVNRLALPHEDSELGRLLPQASPAAVISSPDGSVYRLFPGSVLSLGRAERSNHVRCIVEPAEQHARENALISNHHCEIRVEKRRALLVDTSANGTTVASRRLKRGEEVALAEDDVVELAGVMSFRIRLFTDGERILCVLVQPLRGRTAQHFILCRSAVPFGSDPRLPMALRGVSSLRGAFLYDAPRSVWRLLDLSAGDGGRTEQELDGVKGLVFDDVKLWFSLENLKPKSA